MNRCFLRTAVGASLALALSLAPAATSNAQTAFTPPRDNPGDRARYEQERLKDPATGTIPANISLREHAFSANLPDRMSSPLKGSPLLQAGTWTARGPFSVGGRTRAFAIDVNNESNLLAGGVSGGMWRSIDAGQSWVRTTRYDQTPSVTTLAQDTRPGKTQVWYYGTGERSGSSSGVNGDGIFRSTDNGLTWEQLPSTVSGTPHQQDAFDFIWRVAIDPSRQDSSIVYAAVIGAIYRSANGGTTWNRVLGTDPSGVNPSEMTDIVVTSTGVAYATLSANATNSGSATIKGIYRSTNGITWTKITASSFPTRFRRIVPAVVPSDENTVYFLGESEQKPLGHCLYKYTYTSGDGSGSGGSWTDLSSNLPTSTDWMTGFTSQGSYDLAIAVHPSNQNIVAIAGTNVFVSSNGFSAAGSAKLIGGYNPNYDFTLEGWKDMMYPNHHSDIHYITFLPSNPSVLFTAGDGGIHATDSYQDPAPTWIPLNNGYETSQFYTVAINQYVSGDQTVIGGLQDNHTYGSPAPGAEWEWLAGGDGSYCAIPADNSAYYVSAQSAYICRTTVDNDFRFNGIEQIRTDTLSENFMFIAPFLLDPNDPDMMYLASVKSIWRMDGISGKGTPGHWVRTAAANNSYVTSLAVSTQPANVLYYGTYGSGVYRLDNANTGIGTPVRITDNNLPFGFVSCIAIDPQDADRVLVVISNYNTRSLFYTENGGNTWTDVGGNLEENPDGSGAGPSCNWAEIAHTPGSGMVFLVGTSVGLFSTQALNGASTMWVREGITSIGMSDVRMIRVRQSDGFIAIATHGGGIFTGTISSVTSVSEGTPEVLYLEQNHPNPCNDKTSVGYAVPQDQYISIKMYDALGAVVLTPVEGSVGAGYHTAVIDTRELAAGRYYIRMESNGFAQTRLLTIVR